MHLTRSRESGEVVNEDEAGRGKEKLKHNLARKQAQALTTK
jgi:hypothetical protein